MLEIQKLQERLDKRDEVLSEFSRLSEELRELAASEIERTRGHRQYLDKTISGIEKRYGELKEIAHGFISEKILAS